MTREQVVAAAVPETPVAACGLGALPIAGPALRELYLYWRDKWQGERMPTRADIEPLEIPSLLPQVYLVDIERDPLDFRFRLVGTRIVAWFGRDMTGQRVADRLADRYREVVETGRPVYDSLSLPGKSDRHGSYQRLVMPLAGEEGRIEMLFGGVQPTPAAVRGPSRPRAGMRPGVYTGAGL
ncbi:MAG: PAS domain-containing protein [Tistlia sp.]|uniref:PAS domain-containing protein n=1 Tax=Tistlia sp. TaxID=3057121 RepID=UPI0034A567B0